MKMDSVYIFKAKYYQIKLGIDHGITTGMKTRENKND